MLAMNQPPVVPAGNRAGDGIMKLNNLAKFAVLGLAVLLATGAFASNKGSLHLQESVQVNGQTIPAGDYSVRWEGSGSNVEVSFMQGKKEVAKTSAKVVELESAQGYDSAVVDHSSGTASISQVRFAGKKIALELGGSSTSASASQ
jgi:hypothetical protein